MKTAAEFFRHPQPHSIVKADIVAKYFAAWLRIIKKQSGILTYLDLFSGRGYYEDGTPSTPIKVLDRIVEQPDVHDRLHLHFYEKDKELRKHLRDYVQHHTVYAKLKSKPQVHSVEVNRGLVENLPADKMTFSFIDPCGYQNLSEELLAAVVRRWGSDCLFYLSTSGIRRNIEKKHQRRFMIELFGDEGLERLEGGLANPGSLYQHDSLILEELGANLNRQVNVYMLNFAMEYEEQQSTSHYLVFLCKHPKGFELMKDIMAGYSAKDASDIPLWVYSTLKCGASVQEDLFNDRMRLLKRNLLDDFRGQVLLVGLIVERCHSMKYLYIGRNIKAALIALEMFGEISVDKPQNKRRPMTLGDKHTVTFPE